jgi:hypothetical protein
MLILLSLRCRILIAIGIVLISGFVKGQDAQVEQDKLVHINEIQVIGSHNSYHAGFAPSERKYLEIKYPGTLRGLDYRHASLKDQLSGGVRQIELDVFADPEGGRFSHPAIVDAIAAAGLPADPNFDPTHEMDKPGFKVMHMQDLDERSTCLTFIACLKEVKAWSKQHPDHLPIFILVETKEGEPSEIPKPVKALPFTTVLFDALDAEIRSVFEPREIITPDDVRAHSATLVEAVRAGRWPTLAEARGRVIFLMDQQHVGPIYTKGHSSLEGRVLFTNALPGSPDAALVEQNEGSLAEIEALVKQGYLVRTRTDEGTEQARTNDIKRRDLALASGAQMLSTDYPASEPSQWTTYFVGFPQGLIARCNPVNKPAGCIDALLESPSARASQAPSLVLHRTVTYSDRQTYIELPFEVPKDIVRVTISTSYTEREQHTTIDLGLFDGERFRGWSGGNKLSFTLSETDATPSYLPGPIQPGTWKLILGVPNIREGVRSEFTAEVYFARATDVPEVSTFSSTPLRSTPAWYRGDLHMHDAHSDGSCQSQSGKRVPCPLYKTVESAAQRGLDFIAISDHNTISQFDAVRELQPYFDNLLLLPAREITTFLGHANVYGTTQFIDFRLTSSYEPDVNDLLAQVEKLHAMFSINHPGLPSGESCMGCGWTAPNTDFSRVNAIEIVNGDLREGPGSGLSFWEKQLNNGFRITGIAGSDNHDADLPQDARSAIGRPITVIYANELSERALLAGTRAGHVFVDTEGTKDRAIEFDVKTQSSNASMGDSISAPLNQAVHFTVRMIALRGAHPEIIEDGQRTDLMDKSPFRELDQSKEFDLISDGKRHWFRMDVRSSGGSLLIVSNPIYLNF